MTVFIAALVAGVSYWFADAVMAAGPLHLIWKGAGVSLLALWAAGRARSVDGWLLVAVLTLGAAGDMLIESHGTVAGGAIFLVGHLVAIALYARNLRPGARRAWPTVPLAMIAVAGVAWQLPADRAAAAPVALYAAILGAMFGMATLTRFRRDRVALGAGLFVVSDLLIFARLGPLANSALPDLLVWPTYFAAQALIARGVVNGLEVRRR